MTGGPWDAKEGARQGSALSRMTMRRRSKHSARSYDTDSPSFTCADGLSVTLAGGADFRHTCSRPSKRGIAGFAIPALSAVWRVPGLLGQLVPMTSRLVRRAGNARGLAESNLCAVKVFQLQLNSHNEPV